LVGGGGRARTGWNLFKLVADWRTEAKRPLFLEEKKLQKQPQGFYSTSGGLHPEPSFSLSICIKRLHFLIFLHQGTSFSFSFYIRGLRYPYLSTSTGFLFLCFLCQGLHFLNLSAPGGFICLIFLYQEISFSLSFKIRRFHFPYLSTSEASFFLSLRDSFSLYIYMSGASFS
jgi:hypothetical protein